MELGDFAVFAFIPILLIPIASIYFSLRRLKWAEQNRLFLDSWSVWLIWMGSSIVGFVIVAKIASDWDIFRGLSTLGWTITTLAVPFILNVLSISVLLGFLRKRRDNEHYLFDDDDGEKTVTRPSVVYVSLLITMVATLSLMISLALVSGIWGIHDYFYPKPPVQFGIYDI